MTTLADLLLTLSYIKHCTSLPHLTLPCPKRVCLTPSPPPHRTIRHDTIRIGTTCRTSTQNKARPPTHPATHPQPQDTTPRQGTARHSTLHFTVRPPHDTTQDNTRHGTNRHVPPRPDTIRPDTTPYATTPPDRQTDRRTARQIDRQTDRQTHRQTRRQTDRLTD